MKEIDLVELKQNVKLESIEFYIDSGFIYAKNKIGEVVVVGTYDKEGMIKTLTKKLRLCFDAQFAGQIEKVVVVKSDISDEEIKDLFEKELGMPYDNNCFYEFV